MRKMQISYPLFTVPTIKRQIVGFAGLRAPRPRPQTKNKIREDIGSAVWKRKKILEELTEEQKEDFEKYQKCQDGLDQETGVDAFVTGFRLGVRLFIESFCKDDGIFKSF